MQIARENIRNFSVIAHVDAGKCYSYGTQILLSDGSLKSVENITLGDAVIGLDGKPKRVIEVHKGTGELYKINQKLGNEYIVNGKHILVLKFIDVEGIYKNEIKKWLNPNDVKGDVLTISVEDYLKLPTNIKKILYGFKQEVDFCDKLVELDPYMLGLWLSNGTKESEITSIDQPIIDYIYEFAKKNNLKITTVIENISDEANENGQCIHYRITGTIKNHKEYNMFINLLTKYNVLDNKHIPNDYLFNSRKIRLQVLAGLIDVDGYVSHNIYEISEKSDKLANDIIFLSRSLGFRISHYKKEKTCVKKDGSRGTELYNMINISGNKVEEIPVLLNKKKTKPIKENDSLITAIEVIPHVIGKYAGFQIEGDGKFFAPDFTVWHNSTLSDSILMCANLVSEKDAGQKRLTDNRKDEIERGITIKSTAVSFTVKYDHNGSNLKEYEINLIDCPGHDSFSAQVTTALRVTDGAIVLVDCVEGVCVQTETVLRQALAEQVRPILVINKMDRYFFELNLQPEDAYIKLCEIIYKVNNLISTYQNQETDEYVLSPENNNVFFTSAYHGWGFGLRTFANMYATKYRKDANEFMKYLWGDYYLNTKTNKTGSQFIDAKTTIRIFCQQVYKPIQNIINTIMNYENTTEFNQQFDKKLNDLGIKLTNQQRELREKELYKVVFRKWLPLNEILLYGITQKLPSPVAAQKYRASILFAGPIEHESYKAISECNPDGPLNVYISKMFPMSEGGKFYAFGRVFSGTCQTTQKVTILGPNYDPENPKKEDIFENKSIQRIVKMIGAKIETVDKVFAGDICSFVGIDNYLLRSGTLTTAANPYPIRTMKFSVHPVVEVSVKPKDAIGLHKLNEGIKRLSKSDPSVKCYQSESGEQIVAGVGELHLEICVNDLRDFAGTELIVSEPVVPFRETVSNKSTIICLAKSPNKLNRLYMTAEPLSNEFCNDIESGEFDPFKIDSKLICKNLVEKYGWDSIDAKKIWAFGLSHPTNNVS